MMQFGIRLIRVCLTTMYATKFNARVMYPWFILWFQYL